MSAAARLTPLLAVLAVLLLGGPALAEPRPTAPVAAASPAQPLWIAATPLFGATMPPGGGWFMLDVRLKSLVDEPLEGELEVTSELSWSRDEGLTTTRAPFSLAPRGAVALTLPTHGFQNGAPTVTVVAHSSGGAELARLELGSGNASGPSLHVLNVPNRLTPWLRGVRLRISGRADTRYYNNLAELNVASPAVNPASGELVVPELPAGYAGSTVVLTTSTSLAQLSARAHQALADWVLAGGCLAVALDRPEDQRAPFLTALVGGAFGPTSAPPELRRDRVFETPSDGNPGERLVERTARPSAAVVETFAGYSGGNLHPSPWGSSASYGLGEIHLLAFDPTREPAVSDPWVHLSLVELVRQAWDRKLHVALPNAEDTADEYHAKDLRRLVDPNERTRWAIVVVTLLLLAYSVLAGPLNFYLAARRGRPLAALVLLPVWSLVTLVLVVGIGVVAKGIYGQVRHVGLIEAGAGMARGSVVRFRGFYAPSSRELVVRARADGNVLDVMDAGQGAERVLVVDRDGPRLERFRAKPWQTVLVREDGFVDLAGGVSLVEVGGKLVVKNRLGRHLIGVVVRLADGRTFHLPRIDDGASVAAESGELLAGVGMPTGLGTGLDASAFAERLDRDEAGLGASWAAFEQYAHQETDWWPTDTPVLLAQIAGGAGVTTDAGLALVQDRLLLRVVGTGGRP